MRHSHLSIAGLVRSCSRAIAGLVLVLLASCGGGSGEPASNDRPTVQVLGATLAPGVVASDPAADGLIETSSGVFVSRGSTPLPVGAVFVRDQVAFKVVLVDVHADGSATLITEAPTLAEVYSDLRIYGWINGALVRQAMSTNAKKQRAMAAKVPSCISASPLDPSVLTDLSGFGISIGFTDCPLDNSAAGSVTASGTLTMTGSVLIDFDLAAGTFLFTPSTDFTENITLTVGQQIDKRFPEILLLAPINVPAGVVPLTIEFGVQASAKASGGLSFNVKGKVNISPGRVGYLNGAPVFETVPDVTRDPIIFNPLSVNVDATLTLEPFIAVAIGRAAGDAGNSFRVDLARFRLLGGLEVDMGAKLSWLGNTGCVAFAVSPLAQGDFAPAKIEIGSFGQLGFGNPFVFFEHHWDPIFPDHKSACLFGPTPRIDVALPSPLFDVDSARIATSGPGLTLSALSSVSSEADPITTYAWAISGIDSLSGITVRTPDQSTTTVDAVGLKEGDTATVVLTVGTRGGNTASKSITVVGNRKPTAAGTVNVVGSIATLDGSASQDPEGRLIRWKWVLPNGSTLRQIAAAPISLDAGAFKSGGLTTLTVTDDAGADSAPLQIAAVDAPLPAIFAGPDDTSVFAGQTATFAVSASGDGPLAYQWKKAGVAIPGATAPSYTTSPLALADTGTQYSVVVSNAAGATPSRTATVTVRAALEPDLVVRNISFASTETTPGSQVVVRFDIVNQGTLGSAASTTVVRVNQSSTSSSGANLAAESIAALSAGSAATVSSTITAPTVPGVYRIWVIADDTGTAGQSAAGIANDIVLAAGTLTVSLAPVPDLVVQNASFGPATLAPGGSLTLQFDVMNQGSALAAASTAVVRINQSATSVAGNNLASVSVAALASGTKVSASLPLVAPAAPGAYHVWVIADDFSTSGQTVAGAQNDIYLVAGTLTVTSSAAPGFSDNFDRNSSNVGIPAGNNWTDTAGNVGGALVIRNNALAAPGPDGTSAIFRPFGLKSPITMSGTFTQTSGLDGAPFRYESGFLIGTNGNRTSSGYKVTFVRSSANYQNSAVYLGLNGVALGSLPATFQFGAAIVATVTYSPVDGRLSGTVTGDGHSFPFDFGPRAAGVALPNENVGIELEFRAGQSSATLDPTFDNFTITTGP